MKIWHKGFNINKEIEEFTVGEDYLLDQKLLKYDIAGNIAHAYMLYKVGILKKMEYSKLKKALLSIKDLEIKKEQEDVHTAVEEFLVKKLGDVGKKIHTARSRNDQVLVDQRLYTKAELLEVIDYLLEFCNVLNDLAKKHEFVAMPGYTHMQKAMPSSMGLFLSSYVESLLDDLILLKAVYDINNKSPLGSAAGYGVAFKIDRALVAKVLGFKEVQNNVMYVQNSRPKTPLQVVQALEGIMLDLGKLANDLCLFNLLEFVKLPKEFTTGSSIMPQKKNPDVLELVRGNMAVMAGYVATLCGLYGKNPSGYNRENQLTKKPLMKSFDLVVDNLKIMTLLMKNLKINEQKCLEECTPDIFAADYANMLVKGGLNFRDAYKEVGTNLDKVYKMNPVVNIKNKKHLGATGNLGLGKLKVKISSQQKAWEKEKAGFEKALNNLKKL